MPHAYEFSPPSNAVQLLECLNALPDDAEVVAFTIDRDGKYVALIRQPHKPEPEPFAEDRFVNDGGL